MTKNIINAANRPQILPTKHRDWRDKNTLFLLWKLSRPEMELKEFEPRFKSAKTRFKFSAGLNLETFDTILSRTNHI